MGSLHIKRSLNQHSKTMSTEPFAAAPTLLEDVGRGPGSSPAKASDKAVACDKAVPTVDVDVKNPDDLARVWQAAWEDPLVAAQLELELLLNPSLAQYRPKPVDIAAVLRAQRSKALDYSSMHWKWELFSERFRDDVGVSPALKAVMTTLHHPGKSMLLLRGREDAAGTVASGGEDEAVSAL